MLSCGCWCISRGHICAPKGDDTRIVFSVYDTDCNEFDLSGASEIVFIVADGAMIGGNIQAGGAVLIEKRMTLGDILISTNLYQYSLTITSAESADLPRSRLYYETQVTTSSGEKRTVSAGLFEATSTMIKDIA